VLEAGYYRFQHFDNGMLFFEKYRVTQGLRWFPPQKKQAEYYEPSLMLRKLPSSFSVFFLVPVRSDLI
jgi:hypothetical protein